KAVGLKTAAAVKHGLVPLICVGETLAQRDGGQADAVLALQVHGALQFLEGAAKAATILFAYEPVWAIGDKGVPASSDYADRQQALIKKIARELLPAVPPVLYGGSVNPQNAAELIGQSHIDGLFIGRSAWQAEGYIDILKCASAAI
ncbi:MAG: triosephosphate isomerase, partial [Mesorhizobium sp.]